MGKENIPEYVLVSQGNGLGEDSFRGPPECLPLK